MHSGQSGRMDSPERSFLKKSTRNGLEGRSAEEEKNMKGLSLDELEMVTGGAAETADTYLQKLFVKYGGTKLEDVLKKATDEERDHFSKLFNSWYPAFF